MLVFLVAGFLVGGLWFFGLEDFCVGIDVAMLGSLQGRII